MSQVQAIKQYVKYVGPKDNTRIQFPVPFLCKSEQVGNPVDFYKNKPVPLTPEQAKQLCNTAGAIFKMCDEAGKELSK